MKYPIKLFGDLICQDDINHACLSIFLETTNPKIHEQVKNQILKNQEIVEKVTDYALRNNFEELYEIIKGEENNLQCL